MNPWKQTLEIARWEFLRFFKLKQQAVGLLIGLGIGLVAFGVGRWIHRDSTRPLRIAIVSAEPVALQAPPQSRFRFEPAGERRQETLREAVAKKELDGVLTFDREQHVSLLVLKEPSWLPQLTEIVTAAQTQRRLEALSLAPQQLAQALAPTAIQLSYHEAGRPPANQGLRMLAMIFTGVMLFGIFIGNAYLFAGITSEKQLRVTEQVVAAVSPQRWIDGKILGLCGVTIGNLITNGLIVGALLLLPRLLRSQLAFSFPAVSPGLALLLLLIAALGFLAWFAFFAAIAATVDDPNNSSRSIFMFLPLLTLSLAFSVPGNPDSLPMQVFSILPITSPTVLPARLLVSSVPAWEIVLALLALAASVWFLRLAAGRIFGMGILMYGKEPSLREMLRAARAV